MIRSLPQSWKNMRMHLTHNGKSHSELEEERLGVDNADTNACMASSYPKCGYSNKRKHDKLFQKEWKENLSKRPKKNQQGEEYFLI